MEEGAFASPRQYNEQTVIDTARVAAAECRRSQEQLADARRAQCDTRDDHGVSVARDHARKCEEKAAAALKDLELMEAAKFGRVQRAQPDRRVSHDTAGIMESMNSLQSFLLGKKAQMDCQQHRFGG